MNLKYEITAGIVALGLAFALGRYSVPQAESDTSKVTQADIQDKKNTTTHEVVVTTKKPDGSVSTTKTIDTQTLDNKTTEKSIEAQTVTTSKRSTINISALVENDFSKREILPLYGISASKEFIGPVTLGAFGLNNGTIGLSIGINF